MLYKDMHMFLHTQTLKVKKQFWTKGQSWSYSQVTLKLAFSMANFEIEKFLNFANFPLPNSYNFWKDQTVFDFSNIFKLSQFFYFILGLNVFKGSGWYLKSKNWGEGCQTRRCPLPPQWMCYPLSCNNFFWKRHCLKYCFSNALNRTPKYGFLNFEIIAEHEFEIKFQPKF